MGMKIKEWLQSLSFRTGVIVLLLENRKEQHPLGCCSFLGSVRKMVDFRKKHKKTANPL